MKKGDIVLIIFLLASSAFIFIKKNNTSSGMGPESFGVYCGNELIARLPLTDGITPIRQGPAEMFIEVKDKKARALKSNCPEQLCVQKGFTGVGEIICVPNKIIIRGQGKGKPAYDAVTK